MLKLLKRLLHEYEEEKRRVAELRRSPFWTVVFLQQTGWEDSTAGILKRRAAKK